MRMAQVKLKIFELGQSPAEIEFDGDSISIGRTPDNDVSLPNDTNISRNHAHISLGENDEYWIEDLGSSNGTFVNNEQVTNKRLLQNGDLLNIGGGSVIEFRLPQEPKNDAQTANAAGGATAEQIPANQPKTTSALAVAAIAGGLAIVTLTGGGLYLWSASNSDCQAEVAFLSPENGSTISEPTEIKVKVTNPKCVKNVIYQLDGEPIETAEAAPFIITIEPKVEFDDGATHVLTAVVVDKKGKKTQQSAKIILEFDAPRKPKEAENPNANAPIVVQNTPQRKTITGSSTTSTGPVNSSGTPNLIQTQQMSENLIRQFSGVNYKLDKQFLEEVRKKTAEYRVEGYFARASQEVLKDSINREFFGERRLDPALGFVLAMSRSKFDVKPNGTEESIWRMNPEIAKIVGYPAVCGGGNLSEANQQCASLIAAEYTKRLVVDLFGGNVLYGVACFGMTTDEAGKFQVSLAGKDLTDFSKVITNQRQREQLVRFFAAGIVAENPQNFGLKRDRPLSDLYRNLMVK